MEIIDEIKITDKHGFIYRVIVKHHPNTGVSIAYYHDRRIASREYGAYRCPTSDDDREWEIWEERFREWADASISDLEIDCKKHFDERG